MPWPSSHWFKSAYRSLTKHFSTLTAPSKKSKRTWNLKRRLGDVLILLSLIILLNIYLPILRLYLPNSNASNSIANVAYSISIPKINAYSPVIESVDPWDQNIYQEALKKGVAEAKGFAKPGSAGTIFLFAHSSDSPFRMTSYNTVFFRLGELKNNDVITIKKNNAIYSYQVIDKKEVWPHEVAVLTQSNQNQLILQTCTPIGTSLKRLLVFARPI